MIWLFIITFLFSCFLLIKSGTWVVRALSQIARALQWSEFLVTFCLMALATSLPELFIGLSSAFHQLPQLSFGNIIGANILNLTLGIALTVLLAGDLFLKSQAIKTDSILAAFFAFLPLFLMLDGEVSWVDGVILLLGFLFYFKKIFHQKKKFAQVFLDNFWQEREKFKLFLKNLGKFFGGFLLLLLAAEGVVRSANFLALELNFPLIATGILFVSLGTALPELVFGVRAITLGHKKMVLGNFMGTVVINSTLILGLVSLISPLKILDFSPYLVGILFTFFVALSFSFFVQTGQKITKKEAWLLISIYLLFLFFQILLS